MVIKKYGEGRRNVYFYLPGDKQWNKLFVASCTMLNYLMLYNFRCFIRHLSNHWAMQLILLLYIFKYILDVDKIIKHTWIASCKIIKHIWIASCIFLWLLCVACFAHRFPPPIGCVVPGAGAAEVAIAEALSVYKHSVKGRARLGVQAFADALLIIPKVQPSEWPENSWLDIRCLIINCSYCLTVNRVEDRFLFAFPHVVLSKIFYS